MSTVESIFQKTRALPGSLQSEVLHFVEFLERKHAAPKEDWAALSLTNAWRGMENEEWPPYSERDLIEKWQ